jgi:hypothetical protein
MPPVSVSPLGSLELGCRKVTSRAWVPTCLAIVGPPDRSRRAAQLITEGANMSFRIEVFSDRMISNEELGQRIAVDRMRRANGKAA